MNSRSASIVGDREAGGSSSFAWCNRQWLWSQALTWRSSTRLKLTVFDHNLLWLPESNGYPHHTKWRGVGGDAFTLVFLFDFRAQRAQNGFLASAASALFQVPYVLPCSVCCNSFVCHSYEKLPGCGGFFPNWNHYLFRNQQVLRKRPFTIDPLGIAAESRPRRHLLNFLGLVFVRAF